MAKQRFTCGQRCSEDINIPMEYSECSFKIKSHTEPESNIATFCEKQHFAPDPPLVGLRPPNVLTARMCFISVRQGRAEPGLAQPGLSGATNENNTTYDKQQAHGKKKNIRALVLGLFGKEIGSG